MNNKHIGQNFDDFLQEEGILEEVNVAAIKTIIAENLQKYMKDNLVTQVAMAKQLQTSRSGLQRLLDPENYSVTLLTLNRAASVIGKKFAINLIVDTASQKDNIKR